VTLELRYTLVMHGWQCKDCGDIVTYTTKHDALHARADAAEKKEHQR
jgi:hypothetical protein